MRETQTTRNKIGILGVICGSWLVGIPALALTTAAMPVSQANPPPSSLLETPSRNENPSIPRVNTPTTTPITPPLPEEQQSPSARVVPVNGAVNVKLVNETYTNVTYQVVGDTKPRTLYGRSDVTLERLETPVSIMFYRPDRGLLLVRPQTSDEGLLEVSLTETNDLGSDKTAITIQENGNVFLN